MRTPLWLCAVGLGFVLPASLLARIDREALFRRHEVHLNAVSPDQALSLGNGGFAFTADVTGLQTLQSLHASQGMPLETLARWAWHTEANPAGYSLEDAAESIDTHGRPVAYPTREKSAAGQWLRMNPHDMPLGQFGFCDAQGAALQAGELTAVDQRLDLWDGCLHSRFSWRGVPVEVDTLVRQDRDVIVVRIRSAALADGRLRLALAFARGHDLRVKNTSPLDWSLPASHSTTVERHAARQLSLLRQRDEFRYRVSMVSSEEFSFTQQTDAHHLVLMPRTGAGEWTLSCEFAPIVELPQVRPGDRKSKLETEMDPERTARLSSETDWSLQARETASAWHAFWAEGAAVDFSGSTDPRAPELERRVVLSEYLTAIQIGGAMPPQETGLTCSSWYGKHHTEMVWWHVAHFAQWGHVARVEQALAWFEHVRPLARETAASRGLAGARWSKMVGPDGRESPGGTSLIYWNQPHPIYLAELVYREHHDEATLRRWSALVSDTADCLASMLHYDAAKDRYELGPPMWIAQELYDQKHSCNPTYELAYWAWALETAQAWRVRQGLPRKEEWDRCVAKLSPLPIRKGRYVALESFPDTWDNEESRHDHPSFLMPYGQFQWRGVDPDIMRSSLEGVLREWRWEVKIWGWDYPMIAMTAARLGETHSALDVLLRDAPNNRYGLNGHCPQRKDLGVYLPANGALLSAVALMAGGWDAAPDLPAPGFPKDGSWSVQAEGFRRLP